MPSFHPKTRASSVTRNCRVRLALGGVLTGGLLVAAAPAAAKGTPEGTQIDVAATLSYSARGKRRDDVAVAPLAVTVARVVDLTVAAAGATRIDTSDAFADIPFNVANTGNGVDTITLRAETDIWAEHVTNIQYFVVVASDDAGEVAASTLRELESERLELQADESATVMVRVHFAESHAPADEDDFTTRLIATSAYANSGKTDDFTTTRSSGSTSRTSDGDSAASGDIVYRDGTGTDGDVEGDGRHSADAMATFAGPPLEVMAHVFHVAESEVGCGDFSRSSGRGAFAPETCIEYAYTLDNTTTDTVSDIDFLTRLDPHLKFKGFHVEGVSEAAIVRPADDADCAVAACDVGVREGRIAGDGTGILRIHALIK